jgi:hypothetical protein
MSKSLKTNTKKIPYLLNNPMLNALAGKLVADPHKGRHVNLYSDGSAAPPIRSLHTIAERTSLSVQDAENIFATLPDVQLSMEILVSCILSPNDMREPTLFWKTKPSKLDPELAGRLVDCLKNFFETDYKLIDMLQPALEDALFKTGSYPVIVIPESTIDDIINNKELAIKTTKAALESFSGLFTPDKTTLKPKGYLGKGLTTSKEKKSTKPTVGMESYFNTFNEPTNEVIGTDIIPGLVTVCDDYALLKVPVALEEIQRQRKAEILANNSFSSAMSLGLEANMAQDIQSMAANLYRNPSFMGKEMIRLRVAEKATRAPIGHPLTLHLPSESIIPVHVPSDVTKHIAYFVLVDEYGNPVSVKSDSKYYDQIRNGTVSRSSTKAVSGLLNKTNRLVNGLKCPEDATTQQLLQSYTQMIELDLVERLRNGVDGEAVEIQHPEEVYRIMLARTLAGKRTQILYVPAELLTYIAFDYNDYGIGRSLLEKSKMLASLRALLTFANTMAAVKNSTNRRELVINVDEDDPEPDRTVELIMNEYAKVQSAAIPLATTSPTDIVDGIRNSQTSVKVQGTSAMPEVSLDVNDSASQRVVVDENLMRTFREDHYKSFGLSPEMVDSTVNVEYAATVITSNQLMNKRIALYQARLCRYLVEIVGKYTRSSGKLCAELIKIIREYNEETTKSKAKVEEVKEQLETGTVGLESMVEYNGGKISLVQKANVKTGKPDEPQNTTINFIELLDEFFGSLELSLPSPDNTRLENQLEQFAKYEEALDKILPYYINTEVMRNLVSEQQAENLDSIKEIVKAVFVRHYLAQNNIMPELKALLGVVEGEDQALNIIDSHLTHATELSVTIGNLITAIKESTTKGNPEDTGSGDFSSDSSSSDTTDFGSDIDDGGVDNFGLDLDSDTETTETTTEETESTDDSTTDNADTKDSDLDFLNP